MIHPTAEGGDAGKKSTEYKNEEWVLAKHIKEFAPGSGNGFEFNQVDQHRKREYSKTTGVQDITAGPDFFVDREDHVPGISCYAEHNSCNQKIAEHFISLALLLNILSNQVSKNYLHNGG